MPKKKRKEMGPGTETCLSDKQTNTHSGAPKNLGAHKKCTSGKQKLTLPSPFSLSFHHANTITQIQKSTVRVTASNFRHNEVSIVFLIGVFDSFTVGGSQRRVSCQK
jgi:hypothetical protein